MRIGFYPGSFDPFTNGHLHVVQTSAELFDKVIIGIGVNSQKERRYEKKLIKQVMEDVLKEEKLRNVEVIIYEGLSIDVATEKGCNFIIRGIRNGMDYYYEENMAMINEEISNIDTVYIRAGKFGMINSSMVVELVANGKDASRYVPKAISKIL